jgi:hypothetical protein
VNFSHILKYEILWCDKSNPLKEISPQEVTPRQVHCRPLPRRPAAIRSLGEVSRNAPFVYELSRWGFVPCSSCMRSLRRAAGLHCRSVHGGPRAPPVHRYIDMIHQFMHTKIILLFHYIQKTS